MLRVRFVANGVVMFELSDVTGLTVLKTAAANTTMPAFNSNSHTILECAAGADAFCAGHPCR